MIIKRMSISDFNERYISSYMEVGEKVEFELVEDSNISIIAHKYDNERTNETVLNLRFVIGDGPTTNTTIEYNEQTLYNQLKLFKYDCMVDIQRHKQAVSKAIKALCFYE